LLFFGVSFQFYKKKDMNIYGYILYNYVCYIYLYIFLYEKFFTELYSTVIDFLRLTISVVDPG